MLGVLRSSVSGFSTSYLDGGNIRSSASSIPIREKGYGEEAVYYGITLEGQRHGIGKLIWQNGDSYYGVFCNDKKEGFGFMAWVNGDSYQGYWKQDMRHGSAKHQYANGACFEGTYLHDKRQGPGTLTWPNGDKFYGTWKDNGRVGEGKLILSDGTHVQQEWAEVSPNYSISTPERSPPTSSLKPISEELLIDLNFDGSS